ncbi:rRNA maturation RNase YbeY [Ketogulonicigenium vulgare]|uniref:rRNA maturation RNase YbeY n=1 Tax=Ketogulonicigenium vulgare TaxID=92945 RepID=UPI002359830A|nr:rRNA maturation RNase YbeY [Ketogulonicigenium vulgare]
MNVDCLIEETRWHAVDLDALAVKAAAGVAARLQLPADLEISLLACNDARIAELNADFRGKPKPTNVLSWPSEERGARTAGDMPMLPQAGDDPEIGDIAIAFETCAREADEGGKALDVHVTHLLVHGCLHLLGFDHERDEDAALMEGLETEILGKMGIADPYSDHH